MNTLYTQALIGGALIGLAALLFAGGLGRVMGISGIIKGVLPRQENDRFWRYLFLVGIVLGVAIYTVIHPGYLPDMTSSSLALAVISGVLVGIGTSLANGCTSGHAVCGIGRISQRSIFATITFVLAGVVTVFITHHTALGTILGNMK